MYSQLLSRVADDVERGGPSLDVLSGHENDPGPSALALRLAGSVHRLVLAGEAPELAKFYPSAGGEWNPEAGWRSFERLLRERTGRLREWLDRPPQTNEVGRSAALMGGLLRIGESFRHPVRLLEIGSSGGLNLRADRFFYTASDGSTFGPEDSPVRLDGAWRGRQLTPWPGLQIAERLGSDVLPVDVTKPDGRLTLMSYVWPDQLARLDRLRNAFTVARDFPVEVRRESAVSFVSNIELVPGTTTVLWHSVTWQYLSRAEQAATGSLVDALGAAATESMPFAHLVMEPVRRTPDATHEFLVVLRLWPAGERRVIGQSAAHGTPTTWE
jgi:hypothetical protein